jgi:hypothetical protein
MILFLVQSKEMAIISSLMYAVAEKL